MKYIKYISLLATACLTASALFLGACSDEWNNHYEGEGQQTAADQPTLLQLVTDDADLKQFLRVLQHTGYDKVLDSPQSLTLWAPVITETEADSVIALYDAQKRQYITMPDGSQRNIQEKDNNAIVQFVQNHIALYGRSVSTEYSDSVRMMNGKYMILQQDNLNGINFLRKNVVACNGIFYKLSRKEVFFANVRDYLEMNPQLTSVAAYYDLFDNYDLDEESSVQRGIVDGKIVYADSVLTLSNTLHSSLGWINREDSSYLFLAPSDELWEREYAQFRPYFNFVNSVENRDSVADLNAKFAIIRGRLFNRNEQRNPQDSMVNTMHVNSTTMYGLNVFSRPYDEGGLLAGLMPQNCSNGQVYVDTEGRIDHKLTFMEARYIAASDPDARRTPLLTVNSSAQPQVSVLTRAIVDTVTYNGQKYWFNFGTQNYMEMRPVTYTGATNTNSSMYFYLRNTLSNVYYNVYLVTMPAYANADGYVESEVRPTRFQVYYSERLMDNRTSTTTNPNDDASFDPPTKDRALNVPDGQDAYKAGASYFQTSGDAVDVICIDRARMPAVSAYNFFGSSNLPAMRYRVTSAVRSPDINSGAQTNVMRIQGLYYIPFATKEEAEAFDDPLSVIYYNVYL
ncbi:MAG: hypothetical protein IJT75_08525 [Bacteroidaceae bacterium]|nr:hypothetical protein [Bacteroidaceae bacterium]